MPLKRIYYLTWPTQIQYTHMIEIPSSQALYAVLLYLRGAMGVLYAFRYGMLFRFGYGMKETG